MAARSKAYICGCLNTVIAVSNLAEGKHFCLLSVVCCVDSGHCNKLIGRPGESYRVFVCVIVYDLET